MQLVSMRCPNCNGAVRQVGEGKFLCESCGTSFLADYDKEDVEYQKIRLDSQREKMQFEREKAKGNNVQRTQQMKPGTGKAIGIIVGYFVIMFVIINIAILGVVIRARKSTSNSYDQYRKRQEEREAKAKEEEETAKRLKEEQESKAEESRAEAEKAEAAKLAAFDITPEDLLADAFFVDNAKAALRSQLEKNSNLYYTNWVWNEEPEYLTSYLLVAKDESNSCHNILISIYKVHWDKVFDDRTDQYVMYDGTCLYNLSKDSDGTIRTDYSPHPLSYNSELIANQFLHGFSDYDQLIRQEIYANSDYRYVEFQFPEETEESTEDAGENGGNSQQ